MCVDSRENENEQLILSYSIIIQMNELVICLSLLQSPRCSDTDTEPLPLSRQITSLITELICLTINCVWERETFSQCSVFTGLSFCWICRQSKMLRSQVQSPQRSLCKELWEILQRNTKIFYREVQLVAACYSSSLFFLLISFAHTLNICIYIFIFYISHSF